MESKTKNTIRIRDYRQQFGAAKRNRILRLIDGYPKALATSEYKYQVRELQRCLQMGLLLSALHNAAALLELFVRDLVARRKLIANDFTKDNWRQKLIEIEFALEEDKSMGFENLINQLKGKVID